MRKSSGDIYDAHIPDYDAGIKSENRSEFQVRSVASKIHKVLILGGKGSEYYCLPIFSEETSTFNLPVGTEGYTDPLQLLHVGHHRFRHYHKNISINDYTEVRNYAESLYAFLIPRGCTRAHWAHVPTSEFLQERFSLKSRPCIALGQGLHIPMMTNNGRYTAPGPIVSLGRKPGKIGDTPLFLPESFIYPGRGVSLCSEEKSQVQEYMKQQLSQFFQCQQ